MSEIVGRQIARLGDTGGGCGGSGVITNVSSHFECYGALVALHGDGYSCSKHGGQTLIGTSHLGVFDLSVIRVGDRSTCGAIINTGAPESDVE